MIERTDAERLDAADPLANLTTGLIDRANVIPDFRGPDSIRLGLSPLYTSFAEVHEAMWHLRQLADQRPR